MKSYLAVPSLGLLLAASAATASPSLPEALAQAQALTKKDDAARQAQKLWTAAVTGDAALAAQALDSGLVDVDVRDDEGATPLIRAAVSSPGIEVLKLLLDRNADVNAVDDDGWSPLMRALLRVTDGSPRQLESFHQVIWLLLDHNASVSVQTKKDGFTPLSGAIQDGDDPDLARMILARHPDVDARMKPDGATPLMLAASYGYLDIAKLLVQAHADLTLRDSRGRTALDRTTPNSFDNPAHAKAKAAVGQFLRSKGAQ